MSVCRWVCISGKRIKKPRISTSPTRPAFSACLSPAGRQWMRKRGSRGPRSSRKELQTELQPRGILGACLGHGEGTLESRRPRRRPRECIEFETIIVLAARSLQFSQSHKANPRDLTQEILRLCTKWAPVSLSDDYSETVGRLGVDCRWMEYLYLQITYFQVSWHVFVGINYANERRWMDNTIRKKMMPLTG